MAGPKKTTLKRVPDPDVVSLLRDILAEAESGEVQGVALSAVTNWGDVTTSMAGLCHVFTQVGALESLKVRLLVNRFAVLRDDLRGVFTDD